MELKALRISEKKAEVLHSMQIMRAEDLLTCYPFRYEHLEAKPRDTWKKEDRIIFEAVILNRARVIRFRGKQSVTRFKVMLEDEELDVSLFNRPWVSAFTMGKVITIIGKYDGGSRVTALQYNFKPMKEQLGIHPVYNVREGITQKELVRYIDKAWQGLILHSGCSCKAVSGEISSDSQKAGLVFHSSSVQYGGGEAEPSAFEI